MRKDCRPNNASKTRCAKIAGQKRLYDPVREDCRPSNASKTWFQRIPYRKTLPKPGLESLQDNQCFQNPVLFLLRSTPFLMHDGGGIEGTAAERGDRWVVDDDHVFPPNVGGVHDVLCTIITIEAF